MTHPIIEYVPTITTNKTYLKPAKNLLAISDTADTTAFELMVLNYTELRWRRLGQWCPNN